MSLDLSLNYPNFKLGMDKTGDNAVYEFDRFRLDAAKLMLYRGDVEVTMPPKMVRTLVVLVESRGTIISKDELLERVWSDTIVDESNLFQHLYHLRKVLGELPGGRPYIETFRRRGYRFNGTVRRIEALKSSTHTHTETPQPPRTTGVERDGNVLRLVDWNSKQEPAVKEPARETEETTVIPTRTSSRRIALVIAAVVLVGLTAIGAAYRYWSSAIPEVSANSEISIVRLTSGVRAVFSAVSPNGDYFAYHEVVEGGERLWLHQVGQANRVLIAEASKGKLYGAKTFSPDGKFLYVSIAEAEGRGDLFRMAAIGGPQTKILDNVTRPISFSPDGSEFVFIFEDMTAATTSLMIADRDGKSQRTILQRPMSARLVGSPAWSPDGKTVVFASTDPDNSIGIYSTDLSGQTVRRISTERWDNAYRIVWLPDGRGFAMIATRSGESYSTQRNQVYYISNPGGVSRRLTSDGNRYQEWSLGATNDDAIVAVPFSRSSQIWSLGSDGSSASAIQLSRGFADGRSGIAPLGDGRVGFVSRVGENLGIWLMNAHGSELKQFSSGTLPVVEELRSDPKGRYFVFSGYKDGSNQLYRAEVDGSKVTQLTFDDSQPVDSSVSPDGEWVVYHSAISGKVVRPPRLFRIPGNGGKPEVFGDVECESPNYSPVGDLLSCIRGEEVVVLSAVDGRQIKTFRLMPYARVNSGVRWTPDGRGIVYIRSDKGFANLWVQPLDGGAPKQLTDFTIGDIYYFAFSSDGTRLFVARGQDVSDAILLRQYR